MSNPGFPYNTRRWRVLRGSHLALYPACEGCGAMGRLTPATVVDHRTPVQAGGHPFPPHAGLASLCVSCHSHKTARGVEAGAARTSKPRKGCNPDGSPLDPSHPWHTNHEEKSLRVGGSKARWVTKKELVSNCNLIGTDHG